MRIKYPVILAIGLTLGPHSGTAKADYVVASNLPDSQNYSIFWWPIGDTDYGVTGQPFTSTSSGILTTIDALMGGGFTWPVANSPPLEISLFNSVNDLPTTLLGTVERNPGDFHIVRNFPDANNRYTFDFSQFQIPLTAGNEYFLAFQTPTLIAAEFPETDAPYFSGLAVADFSPFSPMSLGKFALIQKNGINWQTNSGFELAITVHAVPEPTCIHLLAAAALLGCVARRAERG
jgi:hypothetical protein